MGWRGEERGGGDAKKSLERREVWKEEKDGKKRRMERREGWKEEKDGKKLSLIHI